MPMGDAATAQAQAVQRTEEPAGPQATPDADTEAQPDALDEERPDEPTEEAPEEGAEHEADGAVPEGAQGIAPRAQAAPAAPQSGYGLTWTVADRDGNPVPGATVRVQGPAVSGWFGSLSWGTEYLVTDCTGDPCGPNSLDQDPRPGHFAMDRVTSGRNTTQLTSGVRQQRFRIAPGDAPQNTEWDSSAWVEIPGSGATPSPSPWPANYTDMGTLTLRHGVPLSCVAGDMYSISQDGQLKLIRANTTTNVATVTDIGSAPNVGRSQHFNGLAVGDNGNSAYAFERAVSSPPKVFQYDTAKGTWANLNVSISDGGYSSASGLDLIGGAVGPDGTYWVGGFVKNGNATKGNFQLWGMAKGAQTMELRGQLNLRSLESSYVSNGNGDFAFDSEGNLFLVRGLSNGRDLAVFSASAESLQKGKGVDLIPAKTVFAQGKVSPFSGVNGIAYDASGRLYVGGSQGLGYLDLPLTGKDPQNLSFAPGSASWSTTDLGSCGFPPTVTLQKDLPDGRAFSSDQFTLQLKAGDYVLGKADTTGSASGVQKDNLGPFPVAAGTQIAFSESAANSGTKLPNYASTWQCTIGGEAWKTGTGTQGSFAVPATAAGKEVLCTIKNSLMRVTKTADVQSGTTVDGGQVVTYTLEFDNSAGENSVTVNYRDYLADVLDDATFYDPATGKRVGEPVVTRTPSSITSSWNASKQWLDLGGTVPARTKGTVRVAVQVKDNGDSAKERQGLTATEGFFLRNKLARGSSETPPEKCEPGLCVEHPINAWTVKKSSLPTNGAWLHKGGNAHYSVSAEKLTKTTALTDLVLTDDLTHVFKTAGWAPDAAVPSGAKPRGVYLFDAAGRTLGFDGKPNTDSASDLKPVQEVAEPTQVNVAPTGAPKDMRWIVTSGAPIAVPAQAERVEMWFAVQAAESPTKRFPDPSIWQGQGNAPVTGQTFVNYATGMAKGTGGRAFAPNACVTGKNVPNTALGTAPDVAVDTTFPEQCTVRHELRQNYFTIRKDAGGVGVAGLANDLIPGTTEKWDPDPTGLWNMVGHEFEVRDDVSGKPSAYPSARLCRTDYRSANWDGKWVSGTKAADSSTWDFGENSATLRALLDWNADHPDAQKPLCGTLYPISSGAQKGRWRSENLVGGDYWLVETKAPNAQTDTAGRETRAVPGVQRLADPVKFRIWQDGDGESDGQSMHGRGQLDVSNGGSGWQDRCNPGEFVKDEAGNSTGVIAPGGTVKERPTACVNPTGYLMLVKDPTPAPLPLTGGDWLGYVIGGGAAVLLAALAGAMWWRRRGRAATVRVPRHGA